jgi:phage terminase large subunit-like protein
MHHYACQVLEGVLRDDSLFAFIAHADADDDWTQEPTWRKANPNYGVSVKAQDMASLVTKAIHMPNAAAAFKQKRLNLWGGAASPWLSLDGWRRGQSAWAPDNLAGDPCWIGIDLSSKIDLTAIAAIFPPTETRVSWRLRLWALTPADTLADRAHRDRAPYDVWRTDGYLRTNPGNRIDQDEVRTIIGTIAAQHRVQQIGIDPWNAGNLEKDLAEDGFEVIEIPQTLKHMSAPSKDFEADVLDGLVDAGGNPLMEWAVSNAVVERDNKDNIYPVKKRSRGRIDPLIAALMARKLAAANLREPGEAGDPVLMVVGV